MMIDKELYEILRMFINNKSYCLNEIANRKEVIKVHKKYPTASVRRSVNYLLANGYLRCCNRNINVNTIISDSEKMQITVKGRVVVQQKQSQRLLDTFTVYTQFTAVWVALAALCVACSK